jgi:hypothetical protein
MRRVAILIVLLALAAVLGLLSASITAVPPKANDLLGSVPVPADNPQTPAKISLGKQLYFDKRLSSNNTVSCASCHIPEHYGSLIDPTWPVSFWYCAGLIEGSFRVNAMVSHSSLSESILPHAGIPVMRFGRAEQGDKGEGKEETKKFCCRFPRSGDQLTRMYRQYASNDRHCPSPSLEDDGSVFPMK